MDDTVVRGRPVAISISETRTPRAWSSCTALVVSENVCLPRIVSEIVSWGSSAQFGYI